MRRARPAGSHLLERVAQHARYVGARIEHGVPFGQGLEQGLLVEFGERIPAARRHRNVRCKAQHRDGGLVRFDDAGKDIGRAAAARAFAHADAAGHARIAVGHIGGGAFVACQNVLHPVLQPVHRVVERQRGVAAQAEDVLHAMQLQHAHERLAAGDLSHMDTWLFVCSEADVRYSVAHLPPVKPAPGAPAAGAFSARSRPDRPGTLSVDTESDSNAG